MDVRRRPGASTSPGVGHGDGLPDELRPTPVDDKTKVVIAGQSAAKASYDGRNLRVRAAFDGLASNATEAFLMQISRPSPRRARRPA